MQDLTYFALTQFYKEDFLAKYKKNFEEIEDISELHLLKKYCIVLNQKKKQFTAK